MNRHVARVGAVVAIVVGLAVHIGFGYRLGLGVAALGLLGHVLLGVVAHRVQRAGRGRRQT
ncbi:hypothetical protein AB0K14_29970 [Actinosynnema sp. NPDC050801]|uniref:hypothetical protein n=1 Tax=unclassified Actinosynnema TaxID=2637065 RepID=UPI0034052C02